MKFIHRIYVWIRWNFLYTMKLCHRAQLDDILHHWEDQIAYFYYIELPLFESPPNETCIAYFIIFQVLRKKETQIMRFKQLYCQQLLFKSQATFCSPPIEKLFFLLNRWVDHDDLSFFVQLRCNMFCYFRFFVSLSMSFFVLSIVLK